MVAGAGPVWVSWSSGKDSAWMLHALRAQRHEVARLVTTMSAPEDRVAAHGVPAVLLRAQARAVGAALALAPIAHPCSNADYEAALAPLLAEARDAGACMAFGDLFLADVRAWREQLLEGTGVAPLFPLWGCDTRALAETMVAAGLRAIVTCVDPRALPADFAGQSFDRSFLDALPAHVDPCGERGEFHTFAFDGPMFRRPVPVRVERTLERDGFVFAELRSAARGGSS
jgi:uncharacterized protein (TIGR00290 family)